VQVRNIGTVGGSVAHADPAANYSPILVALAAKFILRSKGGERIVAAADFFKNMFETDLRPTEMLTEIRIPVLPANTGWEYVKLSRRASDFALVSVAVLLRGDEKGLCTEADVVLGSVAPVPVRMRGVEQVLRGRPLNQASLAAAARATTLGPDTQSDVHADAAYRIEVAPVCVRRALEVAVTRMAGSK
jgi:carbon-monoxide dehydrogenase medium subunit